MSILTVENLSYGFGDRRLRVANRNTAMSRQKKLDKMDVIELAAGKPRPKFHFREARTSGRYIFTAKRPGDYLDTTRRAACVPPDKLTAPIYPPAIPR